MSLSEEQKQIIAGKLAEGTPIADIQKIINQEFNIPMTYMDTRFLIDDLDLEVIDNTPKEEEAEEASPAEAIEAEAELMDQGGVAIEVDRIKTPGAALSGTVTFSDGQNAKWTVDSYGRLGLEPDQEDYQPSPEDIQDFQVKLQEQLQGPAA